MRKICKTVTFRIVVTCFLILLPVIIVIMGLAGYALKESKTEIRIIKEAELQQYISFAEQQFAMAESALEKIAVDDFYALNRTENHVSSGEIYSIWKEIKSMREDNSLVSASFVYFNSASHLYLSFDRAQYQYTEYKEIVEYLEKCEYWEYDSVDYKEVLIGNNTFYLYTLQYPRFTLGYLIDQSILSEDMEQMEVSEEEFLLLSNNSDEIDGIKKGYEMLQVRFETLPLCVQRVWPEEYTEFGNMDLRVLVVFMVVLSIGMILILTVFVYVIFVQPLKRVVAGMKHVRDHDNDFRMGHISSSEEFETVRSTFNIMMDKISERVLIEKKNLRLQVNPHLMLNSLNLIYNLSLAEKNDIIQKYVLHLVEYFRYLFRKTDDLVPVESEIKFVENYMEIQKMRFQDKFIFIYELEDEAYGLLIPPLIIENFVENSVKHGINMNEKIEIIVLVTKRNGKIQISIVDSGVGIEEKLLEQLQQGKIVEDDAGMHIGIWNCRKRLELYYGNEATLNIISKEGEGTQVWMELPITEKRFEKEDKDEAADR